MGISTGYGRTITSGSVFAFDTADVINSYKGEPTINYVVDPTHVGYTANEFMQYTDLAPIFNTYGSSSLYSLSLDLKSANTANQNQILIYMQNGSTTKYQFVYQSVTATTEYQRFKIEGLSPTISNPADTVAMLAFYGVYGTGNYPSVKNVQVEIKPHCTPFVNGTRSVTQGLLPIVGNSSIDLTNVSFDSNAQIAFDGTNDYASVTLPSNIDVYCLEMVWYNNNAIPDNDTAIGGPSTYQTPISFNGTGQGVHLGAWTGGLTNEAIHIWGASGVTSNRVYAGVGYHHVVFNWNGTTYDIWVDGVNTKTYYGSGTNYATLITASSIKLGNDSDGYCFNGQIPVTKIYNRPLTQGEIRSNFDKHKKKLFKNSSSNPAHSAQILFDLGYRGDGAYWLRPPGSDTFQVPVKFLNGKALVCVMKGGGGNGFVPDSAYWENSTTLNASDFDLYNQQASKYASYSTIPFKEFYLQIGKTMYPVTFSLAAEVASMLAAQQRSWNDSANRSTPHYWNSQDYRTVPGADPDVTDIMGTEIYMYGMDLKHEGHYGGGVGSSGGRIRAGSILDESTGNTSPLSYGTAGSAFGIGVNGGNPLKTGVCGYAGWSNGSVINSTADWSLWIVN